MRDSYNNVRVPRTPQEMRHYTRAAVDVTDLADPRRGLVTLTPPPGAPIVVQPLSVQFVRIGMRP